MVQTVDTLAIEVQQLLLLVIILVLFPEYILNGVSTSIKYILNVFLAGCRHHLLLLGGLLLEASTLTLARGGIRKG